MVCGQSGLLESAALVTKVRFLSAVALLVSVAACGDGGTPAAPTAYPLIVKGVIVASPSDMFAPTARNGKIIVHESPPMPGGAAVIAGVATGVPGSQVQFSVTLRVGGTDVSEVQNDLAFDSSNTPVHRKANGKPDCTVNPAIDKISTSFGFFPRGCDGAACTSMRAVVLSTDNWDSIPDGSVLYTCRVDIAPNAAPGEYPLRLSGIIPETPNGEELEDPTAIDGAVVVLDTPR